MSNTLLVQCAITAVVLLLQMSYAVVDKDKHSLT